MPGVDRLVPLTPVTLAAVVSAVVAVAVAALLVYAAPKLAALTRMTLEGTAASAHAEPVVENLAAMVYWLVALVPLVFVASRLSVTIDPLSELVADHVAGPDGGSGDESTGIDTDDRPT